MSETILEKAARAACEANEEDWHAALRVGVTDGYFKIARAVLMAVREPGLDAAKAGMEGVALRSPTATWQIMIDATLAQEPGA